jgi:hypothetical protein
MGHSNQSSRGATRTEPLHPLYQECLTWPTFATLDCRNRRKQKEDCSDGRISSSRDRVSYSNLSFVEPHSVFPVHIDASVRCRHRLDCCSSPRQAKPRQGKPLVLGLVLVFAFCEEALVERPVPWSGLTRAETGSTLHHPLVCQPAREELAKYPSGDGGTMWVRMPLSLARGRCDTTSRLHVRSLEAVPARVRS